MTLELTTSVFTLAEACIGQVYPQPIELLQLVHLPLSNTVNYRVWVYTQHAPNEDWLLPIPRRQAHNLANTLHF